MKLQKLIQTATLCTLAGSLAVRAGAQPSQSLVDFGVLSGESTGVQKASGDPSPASGSHINDYRFQDEQINLDANAGNVRVLRTDQKALINDFVTETYEVKHADARELRNVLRTVVGLEGGRVEAIKDKEGHESFVQVVCPKFMIPYLDKVVTALDETWVREYDNGAGDVYYKAKNRSAADVDNIAQNYASDSGFSVVDTTNNAVSRIDEPYRIEAYLKAAEEIDIPANQALIEVKLYEINSNNDLKLGLDYVNWKNGPGSNLAQFILEGANANSTNEVFSSIFDPFIDTSSGKINPFGSTLKYDYAYSQGYRAVNYLMTTNFIDFLQVNGKARVMHSEKLMVKSANTASISAEDEIVAIVNNIGDPIDAAASNDSLPGLTEIEGVRASGHTGDSSLTLENENGNVKTVSTLHVPVRQSTRKLHYSKAGKTGVFVGLTPFIGLESMELVVDVEIGDMNGTATNGQPIINTRTVSTTVRLLDGEPYVIGGLKRTHDVRETAKAPFLGDIPGLGYLFGGETTTQRSNDVVIVVTPRFYLASQADIKTPQFVKDIAGKVVNKNLIDVSMTEVGYDQWLLSK